jgi:hypothetical protein
VALLKVEMQPVEVLPSEEEPVELPREMAPPMVVAPTEFLVEQPKEELPQEMALPAEVVPVEEALSRVVAPLKFDELPPVDVLLSEEEPVELPVEQPRVPVKEMPPIVEVPMEFLVEQPKEELPVKKAQPRVMVPLEFEVELLMEEQPKEAPPRKAMPMDEMEQFEEQHAAALRGGAAPGGRGGTAHGGGSLAAAHAAEAANGAVQYLEQPVRKLPMKLKPVSSIRIPLVLEPLLLIENEWEHLLYTPGPEFFFSFLHQPQPLDQLQLHFEPGCRDACSSPSQHEVLRTEKFFLGP